MPQQSDPGGEEHERDRASRKRSREHSKVCIFYSRFSKSINALPYRPITALPPYNTASETLDDSRIRPKTR